jgi:hypothetical protein
LSCDARVIARLTATLAREERAAWRANGASHPLTIGSRSSPNDRRYSPAVFSELAITVADGAVWLSIGQGLLFGAVCLLLGVWIARFVGLLSPDAPAGETLGVGLASGLLVVAAWWAAIASGGRSSFTPVAVGFAIALGLAAVRWRRRRGAAGPEAGGEWATTEASQALAGDLSSPSGQRRNLLVATLGGAVFIVALALVYGSTLVQSPRDGVQPLEVMDEAYYSILGADLARTGTETIYSPSGFAVLDGFPTQTWYHWGEMWLEAAVITVFGAAALDARHFVVLPLLVLAAAALTGTVVRRMTRSSSRGAFVFGFIACLVLAPVPLLPGPHFSSWAVGLIFGITLYGLAAVAVLFAMYGVAVLGSRQPTWALATFAGSAAALIVPAHVVIALLALVGVGSVWAIRIGQSLLATRRLPVVSQVWRRTFIATGAVLVATVGWGLLTGHGAVSGGASTGVTPFNASWRESVAIIALGAGAFLAIGFAWFMVRKDGSMEADLYLGTAALVVAGALVWGALLADIFTFHVFFAAIAVFATPAAAVAVWSIWQRLRATGHTRAGIAVLVLCGTQLELGAAIGVVQLQSFGPHEYPPVPSAILADIQALPPDAKLAYACRPLEELTFWDARLLGIDAHTGRRIVPMCFQADFFGQLIGGLKSPDVPNRLFLRAPQHTLYPDSGAQPTPADIAAFLKANGIDYIYADAMHPNSLVPDAVPISASGDTQVLRLP